MQRFSRDRANEAKASANSPSVAGRFAGEHYDEVYRYCARRLPSKEDAQDATQEVFLRLVRSDALYAEHGKPLAYLYTCARNVCADFYRGGKPVATPLDDAPDIPDERQDGMEERLVMGDALAHLTHEERELLELRYGQGLPMSDISLMTGRSRFALYRMERRALGTLGHILGGDHD